jgi:hypothetical protein
MPNGTYRNQVQPLAPNISVTADLKKEWREPFGTFFAAGNRPLTRDGGPEV